MDFFSYSSIFLTFTRQFYSFVFLTTHRRFLFLPSVAVNRRQLEGEVDPRDDWPHRPPRFGRREGTEIASSGCRRYGHTPFVSIFRIRYERDHTRLSVRRVMNNMKRRTEEMHILYDLNVTRQGDAASSPTHSAKTPRTVRSREMSLKSYVFFPSVM